LRIKTDSRTIHFSDALQGDISENLATQHGDFILKRKDGIIAYQFAVVLDDRYQNVTDVVRGVDLLDSTPKQIYLQHCLGISTPSYMHLPIIIDENGEKLSKQTRATAVDTSNPPAILFRLLQLLKQQPPALLQQASTSELLHWAIAHWHYEPLKNNRTIAGF
jgi:glutamyl-Q tRNA(Asp) synthetase